MPRSFEVNDLSPILKQDAHCIYCHTDIVLNDHVTVCDACQSPHHVDCWQANAGRCATFGCVNGNTALSRSSTSTPTTSRQRSSERPRRSSQGDSDSLWQRIPWRFVIFAFFIFSGWCSDNSTSDRRVAVSVPTPTPYSAPTRVPTPILALNSPLVGNGTECESFALAISIEQDSQFSLQDDSTRLTVILSNQGDVALNDISVMHTQKPSCDGTISSLSAGESYSYPCEFTPKSDDTLFEVRAVTAEYQCEAAESLLIERE